MKDTWIIQVEQLREWKELIYEGKGGDVVGQINDILNQCVVEDDSEDEEEFYEVKLTFIENIKNGKLHSVDAWDTDCHDEEGMSLAKIWMYDDGRFFIRFEDEHLMNPKTPMSVYRQLEKLLEGVLLGKEIKISDTYDDDLFAWLEENKDTPLIVETLEIESWGLWIKDCPYRIDLSDDYYYLA